MAELDHPLLPAAQAVKEDGHDLVLPAKKGDIILRSDLSVTRVGAPPLQPDYLPRHGGPREELVRLPDVLVDLRAPGDIAEGPILGDNPACSGV